MDFVDEQDGARRILQLIEDRFQPLLEIAAVAGAGKQRAHVQGKNGRSVQHLRHFAIDDPARQTFGDRGLADARIADIERIVLGSPAQDLDRALDLGLPADQGVDPAVDRLGVQVDAIGGERLHALLDDRFAAGIFIGALGRAGALLARHLGNAVRDIVDGVEARHVLLLQEIDRVGFALGEHGDDDVGAGHLLAAGRLDVNRGALQDALEARRRLGVFFALGDQAGQFVVDILRNVGAQLVDIDVAGAQDGKRVLVLDQRQQQMLQRRELVAPFIGQRQSPMEASFQIR